MDVDEITAWGVGSLQYADPVLDKLDIHHVVHHRLFRESCHFFKGNYVKVCVLHGARRVRWRGPRAQGSPWRRSFITAQDLSRLGRELRSVLIIDNSPASYIFQPENALPISSWIDNPNDQELLDLITPLTELTKAYDVSDFLRSLQ